MKLEDMIKQVEQLNKVLKSMPDPSMDFEKQPEQSDPSSQPAPDQDPSQPQEGQSPEQPAPDQDPSQGQSPAQDPSQAPQEDDGSQGEEAIIQMAKSLPPEAIQSLIQMLQQELESRSAPSPEVQEVQKSIKALEKKIEMMASGGFKASNNTPQQEKAPVKKSQNDYMKELTSRLKDGEKIPLEVVQAFRKDVETGMKVAKSYKVEI